jgi:hypothetical protein
MTESVGAHVAQLAAQPPDIRTYRSASLLICVPNAFFESMRRCFATPVRGTARILSTETRARARGTQESCLYGVRGTIRRTFSTKAGHAAAYAKAPCSPCPRSCLRAENPCGAASRTGRRGESAAQGLPGNNRNRSAAAGRWSKGVSGPATSQRHVLADWHTDRIIIFFSAVYCIFWKTYPLMSPGPPIAVPAPVHQPRIVMADSAAAVHSPAAALAARRHGQRALLTPSGMLCRRAAPPRCRRDAGPAPPRTPQAIA